MQGDGTPHTYTSCKAHQSEHLYGPATECLPCMRAKIDELEAKCRRYEKAIQAHHDECCDAWWDDPCNCWVGSTIGLIP